MTETQWTLIYYPGQKSGSAPFDGRRYLLDTIYGCLEGYWFPEIRDQEKVQLDGDTLREMETTRQIRPWQLSNGKQLIREAVLRWKALPRASRRKDGEQPIPDVGQLIYVVNIGWMGARYLPVFGSWRALRGRFRQDVEDSEVLAWAPLQEYGTEMDVWRANMIEDEVAWDS